MTLEDQSASASPTQQPASGGAGDAAAQSAGSEQARNEAPANEAAKRPGTLIADAGGDDPPVTAPADWPTDWRDRLAGGDEKARKRLDRFKSPADVYKSWAAAEQRINSGELKKPPPENPSEQELAEYRRAHGIPDKPDGYKIEGLPRGFEFAEEDQPMLSSFLKAAHEGNMPPQEVNRMVGWYASAVKAQIDATNEADLDFAQSAEDALRAEWGPEYRRNVKAVNNYIGGLPGGLGEVIANARGPDGRLLGDNPAVIKFIADLAVAANPGATFVAGDGSAKSMDARKAEIEKIRKTDIDRYFKDGLDKEFYEILQREEQAGRKAD